MAISFTRPDPASPASVSAAQFPTSRRGYDQAEVRDFLRMVAAEQARLQERERFLDRELKSAQLAKSMPMESIDEDTATRLLGEEAARLLQTAREAAVQIRTRAEESSARLLREATDEAQRLREEAEIEAARRRQDSSSDAEAELQMAKQQGRDMVNEARAYRERVLSELARRRELARQQIEQLIHGRDRLLLAFERSRVAAVEVMAELAPLGEPNEYVNLQATTGPVPIMVPSGAQSPAPEPEQSDDPVSATAGTPMYDVDDEPDDDDAPTIDAEAATDTDESPIAESAGGVVADDFRADLRVVENTEADTGSAAPEPDAAAEDTTTIDADDAGDGAAADAETVAPEVEATEGVPTAGVPTDVEATEGDSTGVEAVDAAEVETAEVGVSDNDDRPEAEVVSLFAGEIESSASKSGATVGDLFARLRASRTDEVVRAAYPAPSSPGELKIVGDDLDSPAGHAAEDAAEAPDPTDEVIVPLIVSAARKLKRVLADEQNDLLDTLRRTEPVRTLDILLPWEADQSARYVRAVEDDLLAAATAGAQGSEDGRNAAIIRPAIDAVTNEIVAPLRDRLIRCIDKSEGNNVELGNQVRSLYREWKTQRIDEHVEDIVRLAYERGALTIASR